MFLDKENLFSDEQAVTVSAASTNVIDLGAEGADVPTPNEKNAQVFAQVVEDFAANTSVKVSIQHATDAAFTTPITAYESGVVLTASLVAGYKFALSSLPEGLNRYVRLYYTGVGTATAGKITSGLILDRQTNG